VESCKHCGEAVKRKGNACCSISCARQAKLVAGNEHPQWKAKPECLQCGQPVKRMNAKHCGMECSLASKRDGRSGGKNNPAWKGGRTIKDSGYVMIRNTEHHRSSGGYVREHILVMENILGRPILRGEIVHHRNGDPSDNAPENLQLFASSAEHSRHHGGRPSHCFCGSPHAARGLCRYHYAHAWYIQKLRGQAA